jgi:hypothetical protein
MTAVANGFLVIVLGVDDNANVEVPVVSSAKDAVQAV